MKRRTFLAGGVAAAGALAGTTSHPTRGNPTGSTGDRTMRLTLRRSAERGHARHGWLDSRHTFSFADYYDEAHMGFRSLRVINEDRVQPGRGFGTHPHRDMEIFSYVLEGALEHRDSMKNGSVLRPGQVQLMSAGTGVTHSEFNPSRTEATHFLQIWIEPRVGGLTPGYTEWHPSPEADSARDVVVISPDGRDGSAVIHQDAVVHRIRLAAGDTLEHRVQPGRGAWLQVIRGSLSVGATELLEGDGASTEDAGLMTLRATAPAEALLFDLA
jgi:redox-sensitive bicupin YhaK (pirin superfamily)